MSQIHSIYQFLGRGCTKKQPRWQERPSWPRGSAIETSEGTKTISLYVTQVVETKSYAVFAAGVCPVDEPPGSIPVMCKSEYSALSARK